MEIVRFTQILTPLFGIPFTNTIIPYLRQSIWDLPITRMSNVHCYLIRQLTDSLGESDFDKHIIGLKDFRCQTQVYKYAGITDGNIHITLSDMNSQYTVSFIFDVNYKNEPKVFDFLYKNNFIPFRLQPSAAQTTDSD